MFASVIPWAVSLVEVLNLDPVPYLDAIPLAFVVFGLAVAWSIARLRRGDILAVSREATLENLVDGVLVLDEQNRVIDLNRAAEQLLGRSLEQARGRRVQAVWSEWPAGLLVGLDSQSVTEARDRSGYQSAAELTVVREGEMRVLDVRCSPLTDWRDRVLSRVVVVRDISDQRRAEQETRHRRQSLVAVNELALQCATAPPGTSVFELVAVKIHQITGSLAVTISTYDPDEHVLVVRHVATHGRLLAAAQKVLGQRILGMRNKVSEAALERMRREVINTERDLSDTTFGSVPRGVSEQLQKMLGIASFTGLALFFGDELVGTIVVVMGHDTVPIVPDVARAFAGVAAIALRRQDAEVAYSESKDRYRLIFQESADGMLRVDRAGKVTDLNQRMGEMLGEDVASHIGLPLTAFRRFFVADSFETVMLRFQSHLQGSEDAMPYMLRLRHKDGHELDVEVNARPMQVEGVTTGEIVTVRDVSDRLRVERDLWQRNRELEVLNQAAQAFNATLELDDVLHTLLTEIRDLLEVVGCSAWLRDPSTGGLVCRQAIGPHNDLVRGWRLEPGQGIAGWVAEQGEGVIVPHVEDDPRYYSGVDSRTGLWLNAVLAVPLQVKQRVIGVLEVVDDTGGRFTPANKVLVEAMASIAAVAIENASLFGQTRQDAEVKATLLREVNHRVKNNLVSIMGLLSMERAALLERELDPEAVLSQLEERIRSMLTVHEMLSAVQWSPLRLSDLLEQVVGAVLDGSTWQSGVEVHASIGPGDAEHEVWIEPQEATSLALIVNELAINSLKHAFDGRDRGRIDLQIEATEDREEVVLVYRDDGPGWPDDVLAGQRRNTGLGLVRGVVRSPLRGQIELSNDRGAVVRIAFRPVATRGGRNRLLS